MINFYPSTHCSLYIEKYDPQQGYVYLIIGVVFEENIKHARELDGEWAITARKSGEMVVIAQSRNWRDRSGEKHG